MRGSLSGCGRGRHCKMTGMRDALDANAGTVGRPDVVVIHAIQNRCHDRHFVADFIPRGIARLWGCAPDRQIWSFGRRAAS